LLEKRLRIGKKSDAAARGAFSAEIIGKALAVGGLREHARQGEFSDATRTRKEQRVWDASGAQAATQCGDDALITEKFGEAHG
jgi:hypothetical protein